MSGGGANLEGLFHSAIEAIKNKIVIKSGHYSKPQKIKSITE